MLVRIKVTILCIVILLLSIPAIVNAQNEIVDSKLELLSHLNIIDINKISLNDNMTRADIATVAAKLLGIQGKLVEEQIFTDVTSKHENYDAINSIAYLGVISGNNKGEFRPDEPVTYPEIIKILAICAGYDMYAKENGGYPSGYMVAAINARITRGVDVTQYMRWSDAVTLIYNTLFAPIVKQTTYGADEEYEIVDSENLLYATFKYTKKSGVVTAVSSTSLDSKTALGKTITIDKKVFSDDDMKYQHLLGYSVDYFTAYDDEKLMFVTESAKNSVIDIKPSLVKNAKRAENGSIELEYYEKKNAEKSASVILPVTIDTIYNGVYRSTSTEDFLFLNIEKTGNIKLIDNNNDGSYDVAIIEAYRTVIVGNISFKDEIVYDKYTKKQYELKADKSIILKGDELVTFLQINVGDVLAVAEGNDDYDITKVIIVQNVIIGKALEIDNSANKKSILIDSTAYDVSDFAASSVGLIIANDEGVFFLDYNGEIVDVELKPKSEKNYGYLFALAKSDGLSENVSVKILETDGEFKVYTLAKRINYCGSMLDTSKLLQDTQIYSSNKVIKQLVNYKVGVNGIISVLNIAENEKNENTFSRDFQTPLGEKSVVRVGFVIDNKYMLSYALQNFLIPADKNDNESDYGVSNRNYFSADTEYVVEAYDTEKGNVINLLVTYVDSGSATGVVDEYDIIGIVDKLTYSTSKDGQTGIAVNVLENGAYVKRFFVDENKKSIAWKENVTITPAYKDMEVKSLECGDVIQYTINMLGVIKNFRVLHKNSYPNNFEITEWGNATVNNIHARLYLGKGEITEKYEDKFLFNCNENKNWERFAFNTLNQGAAYNTCVYRYSKLNKKVSFSSYNEVEVGDKVLVAVKETIGTRFILIYEK